MWIHLLYIEMQKTESKLLITKTVLKDFAPAIILWMFINYLLFLYTPSSGGGHIPHLDKIVHFCLFASFSFTVYYGINRTWKLSISNKIIVFAFFSMLVYAGITELIQHNFIVGRSGDWYDFVSDILGILAGYLTLQRVKFIL